MFQNLFIFIHQRILPLVFYKNIKQEKKINIDNKKLY